MNTTKTYTGIEVPDNTQWKERPLETVQIGTEEHWLPMREVVKHADKPFSYEILGLAKSDTPGEHYAFTSERSSEEVWGDLMRNLPSPSMLLALGESLSKRQEGSKSRVEAYIGAPGVGKTFGATLLASLRTKEGALVVDCGNRDMGEMFYETVLDRTASEPIFDSINSALSDGKLSDAGAIRLASALKGHFITVNGEKQVDWKSVFKVSLTDEDRQGLRLEAEEKVKAAFGNKKLGEGELEDLITKTAAEDTTRAEKELRQREEDLMARINGIAKDEGLLKQGSSGVQLTTREGPLIRAFRENREVILDEYNKAKPGTDGGMMGYLQVMTGEKKSHAIKGPGGKMFVFDRDNMPPLYRVTVTGNKSSDGASTHALPASVADRIKPIEIATWDEADWEHAITQAWTGLPISTLYQANKTFADKNPEGFTNLLLKARFAGLNDQERADVPAYQVAEIQNWKNVITAAENYGQFFKFWNEVLDTDRKVDAKTSIGKEIASAQREIRSDRDYRSQVTVGRRRIIDQMIKALRFAVPVYSDDVERPKTELSGGAREQEPIEAHFGDRLAKGLLEDIHTSTTNKEELRSLLLKKAEELNLLSQSTQETRVMEEKALHNLLNIDANKVKLPAEMEKTHNLLCDYLRDMHKEVTGIELTGDNSDIIKPSDLTHALTKYLNEDIGSRRLTTRTAEFVVPDTSDFEPQAIRDRREDLTNPERDATPFRVIVGGVPFAGDAQSEQGKKLKNEGEGLEDLRIAQTQDLVDAKNFLVSLAIPELKDNNLKALWNQHGHITDSEKDEKGAEAFTDSNRVLENRSATGLAFQMILAKSVDATGAEKDEYLYVVHDSKGNDGAGKTLITGSVEINDRLKDALDKQGITYVNRNAPEKEQLVDAALTDMLGGKGQIKASSDGEMRFAEDVLSQAMEQVLPVVSNPTGARANDEYYFNLPHPRTYLGQSTNADGSKENFPSQEVLLSDQWRSQCRENLVALLADRGSQVYADTGELVKGTPEEGRAIEHKNYIDLIPPYTADEQEGVVHRGKSYFTLTNQPDLERVKHRLKALTADAPTQQAAIA